MARYIGERDVTQTLAAAEKWFRSCLVEDGSVFSSQRLWRTETIQELIKVFVESPDDSNDNFYDKLQRQIEAAGPEARRLMAEMIWILLLFQTRMRPETKRDNIARIWSCSGEELDRSLPLLSDDCLLGIGHPGQGYNNWRWKELAYLITVAKAFKTLPAERRNELARAAWSFADWLETVPMEGYRQFRNILCYLVFPDEFERITVAHDKADILISLAGAPRVETRRLRDIELDRHLVELRRKLAAERGNGNFDFYEPYLASRWKPAAGAWLLSWNPNNWSWESFENDRQATASGNKVRHRWACANSKAKIGDTAYLVRTGSEPRGIIARGNIVSAPYRDLHYDPGRAAQGDEMQFVDVDFTDIRDPLKDPILAGGVLEAEISGEQIWNPQSSGIAIKAEAAAALDARWKALPIIETGASLRAERVPPVNEIVFGPPGTGKTYWLQNQILPKYSASASSAVARPLVTGVASRRFEFVTFHQSYTYEDFVEGIRPRLDSATKQVVYEVSHGVFRRLCERARKDPANRYALVVDEINRGNIARIFGELVTLIEIDKRVSANGAGQGIEVILPYSGDLFGVPDNLDIYATMNTADRSIALLDAALRRRFQFREIMPTPGLITGAGDGRIPDGEDGEIDLRRLLGAMNDRIAYLLSRDQTIGHAYLMGVRDFEGLKLVLGRQVIPLLQELFYGDWPRMQLVLADAAVFPDLQIVRQRRLAPTDLFGTANLSSEGGLFEIVSADELTPDMVRKIYEPVS